MRAPLALKIRTDREDKLALVLGVVIGALYVVTVLGIVENDGTLNLLGAISLAGVVVLMLGWLLLFGVRITPEKLTVGRLSLPLSRVKEIKVNKAEEDSPADLIVLYDGGELVIKGVKNWKEVLNAYRRFRNG